MESLKKKEGDMEAAHASMLAAQPRDRGTRLRYNLEELVGQPKAIKETLSRERDKVHDVAAQISDRLNRRIFGIGCGDSWFTVIAVRTVFEQMLGLPFEPLQALEFTRYASSLVGKGDLVFGLSASGTTAETTQGLQVARAAGAFTVGITLREDSPFAEIPDQYLLAHAKRRASFPTQASTTSLGLILALAAEIALLRDSRSEQAHQLKEWLDGLPTLVRKVINDSQEAAADLSSRWINHEVFTFVGAGPGKAAAMFGAAKIREGSEAIGWSIGTEEFHHYSIVRRGDPIFLVAPNDPAFFRAIDVARETRKAGGLLYSVVPKGEAEIAGMSAAAFHIPVTPPALIGLPYALPLQLAAWHISQAKFQAGILS